VKRGWDPNGKLRIRADRCSALTLNTTVGESDLPLTTARWFEKYPAS
jgi:hypothetical protein